MTSSIRSIHNFHQNNQFHGWKDLKKSITRYHGLSIKNEVEMLEKTHLKNVKLHNDIVFLKRCQKTNLIPPSLKIKNK